MSEKTDIALNNRITSEVLIFYLNSHQIKGSYFKHNLQNCTHGVMKQKVFLYVFKTVFLRTAGWLCGLPCCNANRFTFDKRIESRSKFFELFI